MPSLALDESLPPSQARHQSPLRREQVTARNVKPAPLPSSHAAPPVASATRGHPHPAAALETKRGGPSLPAAPQSSRERSGPDRMASGSPGGAGTLPATTFSLSTSGSPAGSAKSSPRVPSRPDLRPSTRNVSAPDPPMSPPQSPAEAGPPAKPMAPPAPPTRADPRLMVRNVSIDSTASGTSSTASQPQPQDPSSPNAADIAAMITAAGSAEAVIRQLVKEKKQAATQNAQLFRLVQKQRSLIYGLNQDLERAVQEKEKFRKHVREESAHVSPAPAPKVDVLRKESPARSVGTGSTHSEDELPIQRHSTTEETLPAATSHPTTQPPSTTPTLTTKSSQTLKPAPAKPDIATSPKQGYSPIAPVAPLMITKRPEPATTSPVESKEDGANGPSLSSFAARRSFVPPRKSPTVGSLPSSPNEEPTVSPTLRKGPPAPLKLKQDPAPAVPKFPQVFAPEDHSDSEYDEHEVDEITGMERGRKKTRAEDDLEREILIKHEQSSRSASKKGKGSKPGSQSASLDARSQSSLDPAQYPLPKSPLPSTLASPAGSFRSGVLSPHASIAGMLSGPASATRQTLVERHAIASPPLSPGLPISPRPVDRPTGAPVPRQPREGYITAPPGEDRNTSGLAPRSQPSLALPPPRGPPAPHRSNLSTTSTNTEPEQPMIEPPTEPAKEQPVKAPTKLTKPPPIHLHQHDPPLSPRGSSLKSPVEGPRSPVDGPKSPLSPKWSQTLDAAPSDTRRSPTSELMVEGVYRGLVAENYPTLLLPPSALSTISIKVTSSRLKPSRASTIMLAGAQEEPVFTLGVTARSNAQQLWRVEKPIMSLPQLEHFLKQLGEVEVKLPDRSLFSGHAPAKIDARRAALEHYFDALLNMPLDDSMALVICKYLSSHVIPCEEAESVHAAPPEQQPASSTAEIKIIKEGYLTKRGKQFGGWKARFFVLDEPILRYYDAPGGSLQGTIKLYRAQIGRQSTHTHQSPSRDGQSADNQFRHAFLIMEPKKKDTSSHVRHVLCAENDQERDEWVYALLQYVNTPPDESKSRPPTHRAESDSKNSVKQPGSKGAEASPPLSDTERFNSLQGVSYEDTTPGEAPRRSGSLPRDNTASPASQFGSSYGSSGPPAPAISGPRNGAVIQDAGAWGNKSLDVAAKNKEKEQKKRSIWGIRDRIAEIGGAGHNHGPAPPVTRATAMQQPVGFGNNHKDHVFGAPLTEAIEFCMAPGSNLCLPAVVYRCLTYLDAKGAASEEGIFRLSGSNTLVRQLKEKFNTEGDFDFLAQETYYDVHAVASLLKLYLRELPHTVLTRRLHLEFLAVLDMERREDRITAYCVLAHRLPLPNWTLVRCLSDFLLTIVNNSQVNKMSVRNVGIVFAPTLNIPAPVFAAFLTDFDAIFNADPPEDAPATYSGDPGSAITAGSDEPRSGRQPSFGENSTPLATPSFAPHTPSHPPGPGLPTAPNEPHRHPERYSYIPGRVATPTMLPTPQSAHAPHSTLAPHHAGPPHGALPYETQTREQMPPHASSAMYTPDMHRRPSNASTHSIPSRPSYETALPQIDTSGAPLDPNRPGAFSFTKPNYETSISFEPARPPPNGPPPAPPRVSTLVTPDRPKYSSGIGHLEVMRDVKSRRRESAMIMTTPMPPASARRKSSLPQMDNVPGKYSDTPLLGNNADSS